MEGSEVEYACHPTKLRAHDGLGETIAGVPRSSETAPD